ncbi:MAG: MerR family transcriptional regulator [Nitrospirota bacterium]
MYKSATEKIKPYRSFPDKLFYKIGEVSRIVGVEPYVLRYWETEFSFLKPRKNKSGQRVYIKKDIELLLKIKRLLYQERYTIEGVRKRLGLSAVETEIKTEPPVQADVQLKEDSQPSRVIQHVKNRLREILSQLH